MPLSSSPVNEEPQEETHAYVDQLPVSEIIHQVREVEGGGGNAKQMCQTPLAIQMNQPSHFKWRTSFRARRRFGHRRYLKEKKNLSMKIPLAVSPCGFHGDSAAACEARAPPGLDVEGGRHEIEQNG